MKSINLMLSAISLGCSVGVCETKSQFLLDCIFLTALIMVVLNFLTSESVTNFLNSECEKTLKQHEELEALEDEEDEDY